MIFSVLEYDRVESTNTIALQLAAEGCADGTIVRAAEQTEGRGRLSRHFSSPPGGLYMSIVVRPQIAPEKISLVTLAAGLACSNAIDDICGLKIALKWPNDLYVRDRKLGGILTESAPYSSNMSIPSYVVVGVGLNVNTRIDSLPPELQESVTSLYDIQNCECDIDLLSDSVAHHIYDLIDVIQGDHDVILRAWSNKDYLCGKEISWSDAKGNLVYGKGAGLLPDGRYQLKTLGGELIPILAGDLSIYPIAE